MCARCHTGAGGGLHAQDRSLFFLFFIYGHKKTHFSLFHKTKVLGELDDNASLKKRSSLGHLLPLLTHSHCPIMIIFRAHTWSPYLASMTVTIPVE